jgi:hypothetical protein
MFLPFLQTCFDSAVYEQQQRAPYMQTKFADGPKRRAGQLRGLVVEHHVRHWLREQLPNRVLDANNAGKWTEVCNHDFKLVCSGGTLLIDVSGPKADGSFGSYALKPRGCHFHILARPIHMPDWQSVDFTQGFIVEGVVTADAYKEQIDHTQIMPFESWIAELEV